MNLLVCEFIKDLFENVKCRIKLHLLAIHPFQTQYKQ